MRNYRRSSSMATIGMLLLCVVIGIFSSGEAIEAESPEFEVVRSESDFEIRLYSQSSWMSASIPHLSFAKATRIGYHRLFQYIQGANLNSSRIPMTIPVLTGIVPKASLRHPSSNFVRFYLPAKFQADPPTPLPELKLKPYPCGSHYVAVRKFSGFARDWNVGKEAENLANSLSVSQWANCTALESGYSYYVAQYSSPFKFTDRLNEVWIDVDGPGFEGCKSSGMASY